MIFDNICNLREDNDKTQKELADYLVGRTKKIMNGSSPIKSVKNSHTRYYLIVIVLIWLSLYILVCTLVY